MELIELYIGDGIMEIWKDIKDYQGLYMVSNYGRVKSLKDNHGNYREKILRLRTDKHGYKKVSLYKNGKPKTYKVHRLVASAFIENLNNYPYINHRDENSSNNHVSNLEWCTHEYNINYGTRNERASKARIGKHHTEESKMKMSKSHKGKHYTNETKMKMSKAKFKKVKCINTEEIFDCIKDAAEWCNGNKSHITDCCKGRLKTSGKHPVTKEKLLWTYV